jgi:hypothetical protein
MLKDGQVRRVVTVEFAVRDRTRFVRPSHIALSIAIILSLASLLIPGPYPAPLALGFMSVTLSLLLWEWSKHRAAKVTAWLYAAFIAGISIAWSLHPHALRFDKESPRSSLNHAFAISVMMSLLIIAIRIEIQRRWRTERF